MNKQEIYNYLDTVGIQMSKAEEGVLSSVSDYNFVVGEGSEVYVNIGDRKYIRSEGSTSLSVKRGTVFINTEVGDKKYSVAIRIE